jgi:hypothetical protein
VLKAVAGEGHRTHFDRKCAAATAAAAAVEEGISDRESAIAILNENRSARNVGLAIKKAAVFNQNFRICHEKSGGKELPAFREGMRERHRRREEGGKPGVGKEESGNGCVMKSESSRSEQNGVHEMLIGCLSI